MNILIVNYAISLIYLIPLLSNRLYINKILPRFDKNYTLYKYHKIIRIFSIIMVLLPGVSFMLLCSSIYNIIMKNVGRK